MDSEGKKHMNTRENTTLSTPKPNRACPDGKWLASKKGRIMNRDDSDQRNKWSVRGVTLKGYAPK